MSERAAKKPRLESGSGATEEVIAAKMKESWPTVDAECHQASQLEKVLSAHHGPHDKSKIEWWYINGHLKDKDGSDTELSFFAAFFRLLADGVITQDSDKTYVHAINWAIVDRKDGQYIAFSGMDPIAPTVCLEMIKAKTYDGNPFLLSALKEVLEAGNVPLPDSIFGNGPAKIGKDKLQMGESSFNISQTTLTGSPRFDVTLSGKDSAGRQLSLSLQLTPNRGPVLHGRNGTVSMGPTTDDMFYYFYPDCNVTNVSVASYDDGFAFGARLKQSTQGTGWVDHEFGGAVAESPDEFELLLQHTLANQSAIQHAWEWAAIQLDNGLMLSVTALKNSLSQSPTCKSAGGVVDRFAVVLYQDGFFERINAEDVVFTPQGMPWKSNVTGVNFPTQWNVSVKLLHLGGTILTLNLQAPFQAQEFITLAAKPSFWEGYAGVSGSLDGKSLQGNAIVECHGETDLNGVGAGVEMLHHMMVAPMTNAVPKSTGINDLSSAGAVAAFNQLNGYLNSGCTAGVEQAASMLASIQPSEKLSSEQKGCLSAAAALYVCFHHHRDSINESFYNLAKQWLDGVWARYSSGLPNDFKRLLLRTFLLRELDAARSLCPKLRGAGKAKGTGVAAPVDPVIGADLSSIQVAPETLPNLADMSDEQLYVVPSLDQVSTPATAQEAAVAKSLFEGFWRKDWKKSEALSGLLALEGVNLMMRKLTDNVVPTMKTKVTQKFFESQVRTSVSNVVAVDRIDGTEYIWDSSGRGKMTSRSCLLHGGQMLFTQSYLPEGMGKKQEDGTRVMEYKWLHALINRKTDREGNAAKPTIIVQRTAYAGSAALCYFNAEALDEDSD